MGAPTAGAAPAPAPAPATAPAAAAPSAAPAAAPPPVVTRDLKVHPCYPRSVTMRVCSSLLPTALRGIVPKWAGGDTQSVKNS